MSGDWAAIDIVEAKSESNLELNVNFLDTDLTSCGVNVYILLGLISPETVKSIILPTWGLSCSIWTPKS